MRKLFLFRLLGAFSVVRENPRAALKSLNYAANILRSDPNNTLWIFPQGEIMPNDLRPLKFYNGLAKIVKKVGNCMLVSLSMRYEFLGEFKPRIFVKIREPEFFSECEYLDTKKLTEKFSAQMTENLDSLKSDVIAQSFSGYKKIF